MKKYFYGALALLVVAVIALAWWLFDARDIYPSSVYIESGEPFYKVIIDMRDRNLLHSPWFFSKVGIIIGLDKKVRPGRYDFGDEISNWKIIRKFWKGDIAYTAFTVPEGFNLRQIAALLSQKCGTNPERFNELVRDSEFLMQHGIYSGFAEGYLFPETYRFEWGISAVDAITAMIEEFQRHIDARVTGQCQAMGYSLEEMLTMASIVQSEGFYKEEFKKIASVYRNRYEVGMKLQADPTVIYAMGGLDRPLLVKDYQFPSKYNTYIYSGLPPTPICSPGMAAIEAALWPDTTDYFYFVADGSGGHVFNKTYKQHLIDTKRIRDSR